VESDNDFTIEIYNLDEDFPVKITGANLENGRYTASEQMTDYVYYAKIINTSGTTSTNSSYTATNEADITTVPTEYATFTPTIMSFDFTVDSSYSPYLLSQGELLAVASTNFKIEYYNESGDYVTSRTAEFNGTYYVVHRGYYQSDSFYISFVNLAGTGTYVQNSYVAAANSTI
jgi:hypothetical protein